MSQQHSLRRCLGTIFSGTIAACVLLSGCVGHNIYPPMEGERGFTNVNSDPFPPVITAALQWVTTRYPPNADAEWNQPASGNFGVTSFAINLPRGMDATIAERITKNVGNGALSMTPGRENLPTYHVSRIWVNGDEAKVDIIRPVVSAAFTDQGKPVSQGITIRLRGGLKPWTVSSHRLWSFNALQPPAINYIEGEGLQAPAKDDAPTTQP